MKLKTLRTIVPLAVLALAGVGYVLHVGFGDLSALGWGSISVLCPLGALGTMLASKTMVPHVVVSLVIALVAIVLLGRAFCGWICPVPVVSKLRSAFSRPDKDGKGKDAAAAAAPAPAAELTEKEKALLKGACKSHGCAGAAAPNNSRNLVLGSALLSAAIFGFPVFCLVCPIGLTFATILLLVNLFAQGDVTWSLIVVPAILIAEVLLFKKWCHKLCPLSAFMSLIAKLNRTFKPIIDNAKCLETAQGKKCGACGRACEEGIDPRHPELSEAAWSECTKCRSCVDACPANAISMPLIAKKGEPVSLVENEK